SGTSINCPDVFLKDTQTGETKRISTDAAGAQGDRESRHPSISADGRFIAFNSGASNIVPGDTNGVADIFVKDTRTGAVAQASSSAGGERGDNNSDFPAISADGRFVAFMSDATNLVADDTNGKMDVFIKDMQTGTIARVSADASGVQGDDTSGYGSLAISAAGRFVAFDSGATNLVPGDENGKRDIFLKDTRTGAVSLVSADAAGVQGVEDSYKSVSLSADGRLVSFSSDAPNLVPGDTNTTSGKTDIFVKDIQTGVITRVSTSTAAVEANGKSEFAVISADGLFVAFVSEAGNLIPDDTNRKADIFLKNLKSGETSRISSSTSDTMDEAKTSTVNKDTSP
ncbi:MAG: calcium-binding protein, partial [Thermoleophilia bacterium]